MMRNPANTLEMTFQKALVVLILHGSYSNSKNKKKISSVL
jgi:hypothetical protein